MEDTLSENGGPFFLGERFSLVDIMCPGVKRFSKLYAQQTSTQIVPNLSVGSSVFHT